MRTRVIVAMLVVVVAFYGYLIGLRGWLLIQEGGVVEVLLGVALLILPVLGVLLVFREVQFGRDSAALAALLESEGGHLVDDLPKRPSGRVERDAADALFAEVKAEVDAEPDNWRGWYRLAIAYDIAGDRRRARSAARAAIARWKRFGA